MDVYFHHGRKLVGVRTVKARLNILKVTESQFADDVALYTGPQGCLESIAMKFLEATIFPFENFFNKN